MRYGAINVGSHDRQLSQHIFSWTILTKIRTSNHFCQWHSENTQNFQLEEEAQSSALFLFVFCIVYDILSVDNKDSNGRIILNNELEERGRIPALLQGLRKRKVTSHVRLSPDPEIRPIEYGLDVTTKTPRHFVTLYFLECSLQSKLHTF